MQLKFSYPHWGSQHIPLDTFFQKIKEAGYDAVEMGIPFDKEYSHQLGQLLKKYQLSLIAQQVIPQPGLTAEEYGKEMKRYLYHLASFQPEFINSHTGKDYYSFEENCKLFEIAEDIGNNTGIKILHETHRGRALFATTAAKQFFSQFPELRVTADFSHWCCVSESLLHNQQEFMRIAMERSDYIHARVGNEQSPQINHPAAPEHTNAVKIHLNWWEEIIAIAKKENKKDFWICTEFGPEPYLQTLPFTNQAVANQFELNMYIKQLLIKNISSLNVD